jgi:hypothetical protein
MNLIPIGSPIFMGFWGKKYLGQFRLASPSYIWCPVSPPIPLWPHILPPHPLHTHSHLRGLVARQERPRWSTNINRGLFSQPWQEVISSLICLNLRLVLLYIHFDINWIKTEKINFMFVYILCHLRRLRSLIYCHIQICHTRIHP